MLWNTRPNCFTLPFVLALSINTAALADTPSLEQWYKASIRLLETNIDSAGRLATRVSDEALVEGNYLLAGKAVFVVASVYDERNMMLNAGMKYFEALQYLRYSESADPATEISLLKNLGRISNLIGQVDDAVRYYYEALDLAKDDDVKAGLLFNIGYAHYTNAEYDRALLRLFEAYEISVRNEDYRRAANCLNYIGLSFHYNEEYSTAREYFYKILNGKQTLDSIHYSKAEAWATHNIGNSYLQAGELGKAEEFFKQELELLEKIDDKAERFVTFMDLGEVKIKMGNKPEAINYLEQASALYSLKPPVPENFRVFDLLEQAYDGVNQQKHRQYVDRLKAEWQRYNEQQMVLKNMNFGYELERLQQQVIERIQQREQNRMLRSVAMVAAPVALVTLLVIFYFVRRTGRQRKLKPQPEMMKTLQPSVQSFE